MRALLDTNVVLWWLDNHPRLDPFLTTIANPTNEILFSSVSTVEISIKVSKGKLVVPDSYVEKLTEARITELPFTAAHGQALATMAWHHQDPFDRMLIAQALVEGIPVLTSDQIFRQYGLHIVGNDT